jgi:NifU-like protein involved in Fe-S cluster formation
MLSAVAADHVQRPRNQGPLETATHYGVSGSPGDGPYVELWLEVEGGTVCKAAYRTHGCPSSVAASSLLCQLATGRELERVKELTGEELLLVLGGLPEGKERFAHMAVESMRNLKTKEETGCPA